MHQLQSWVTVEPPADDPAPVANVLDASDLGSTLDPDGQKMNPKDGSEGSSDTTEFTLGSTLDPDG